MNKMRFTVIIEQDEDGVFLGSIPSIPNCHAQGNNKEEMLRNLSEVATLCLRNQKGQDANKNTFVGVDNLELINA